MSTGFSLFPAAKSSSKTYLLQSRWNLVLLSPQPLEQQRFFRASANFEGCTLLIFDEPQVPIFSQNREWEYMCVSGAGSHWVSTGHHNPILSPLFQEDLGGSCSLSLCG